MTQLEALVGLNRVSDIGSVRLSRLMEAFGSPENVFKVPFEELMRVAGISQETALKIASCKKEDTEKEFAVANKLGLKIIAICDKDYPDNLKNIPGAPIVLYIKGELRQEDSLAVGIVGSRRASFYGLTTAENFSYELASKGFTIVSGMARGIDTYAHRGALKAGGRTIAIMGSGFAHVYPEENYKLAEEISRNGAVISEFPIETLPLRQNFPRRNRIISGLSLGVLVAEAAKNSGALITADFALEQGREVFALPGKVNSNTSYGTNGLIKQGAKLVTCVDDITEEFTLMKDCFGITARPTQDENALYGVISNESVQIDDLVEKTNMDIPLISDILLRLQLKGLIKQLPGRQFVRLRPLSSKSEF